MMNIAPPPLVALHPSKSTLSIVTLFPVMKIAPPSTLDGLLLSSIQAELDLNDESDKVIFDPIILIVPPRVLEVVTPSFLVRLIPLLFVHVML